MHVSSKNTEKLRILLYHMQARDGLLDTDRKIMELQDEMAYLRDFRDHASLPIFSVNNKYIYYIYIHQNTRFTQLL